MITYGVLDAAVYVTDDFMNYDSGIYSDSNTTCDTIPCYYSPTNHAISLVGWDDDPPEGGGGVWILRNSWGSSWGESGYMRIRYTSALVAAEACYLTWPTQATISCNSIGSEVNQFAPGQSVYTDGSGLAANTNYRIWIQDGPVGEGDSLASGEDPSGTQEEITTDGGGSFGAILIWAIDAGAPVTHHEYNIVVDKLGDSDNTDKFNSASDGVDIFGAAGNSPVLSDGAISPITGGMSTNYTYTVTYTDADNDPPNSITISIDSGAQFGMTAKAGEDGIYSNGETYEYSIIDYILGVGRHSFQFAASDGIDNATGDIGSHSGPTNGNCFIATASYGTDTEEKISILRGFRDEVLLPNRIGARFVSLYYRTSPPIAEIISQHEILRTIVREGFIDPLVAVLEWSHKLWSE